MWSIGVILYTLLIGSFPFANDDQQTLFRIICSGQMDTSQPEWGQVSDEVKDLLKGLLDVNPATRRHRGGRAEPHVVHREQRRSSNDLRNALAPARLRGRDEARGADVRAGEYLVRQGEIGREAFLLRSGECAWRSIRERRAQRASSREEEGSSSGRWRSSWTKKKPSSEAEDRERGRQDARRRDGVEQGGHAVGGGPDYSLENQIEEVIQKRREELSQKSL